MSENTRGNDAVLGFLVGAALGAGLALLFAPASGEETRRKLGQTAQRLGDGMSDKLAQVKDVMSRRASELKGDVEEAIEAGKAAARG